MKFSFVGIRIFLALALIAASSSSCNNLFSKNMDPASGCIDCLQKFSLSAEQENAIRISIHADKKAHRLDSLFNYRAKRLGFNGNVLVIQKGVTLYEHSFGYENYRSKTPLTELSKFQLASLSKTFTAGAVLKLMEDGIIKLQDPVTNFFPDFPFRDVTIEMLLSHRSGVPDYRFAYEDLNNLPFKKFNNLDLMKRFAKNPPPLSFKPGKKFCYCNSNYAILAAILEKISDMPFDEYMRQYVFEPLGMNHTYIITSSSDSLNMTRTDGYNSNWSLERMDVFDGIVGDKGVYSTTEDLAKWYHTLTSECFLKKETLDMAFQPRSFEKKGDRNYGYGFRMSNCNTDSKCIYHNGWWHGYNSAFYMCPKSECVIIVLGNRMNNSVYKVCEVMDILQADMTSCSAVDEQGE